MGKIGENIQHRDVYNVSVKNPDGKKIKKQTFSRVDIASLKPIMRNLESKTHIGKRVQCDV